MTSRIVNPHAPGAPLRMADGRLFTDYRPSCTLLPPRTDDRRGRMIAAGEDSMAMDRYRSALVGRTVGPVDTMVPELYKRIYGWQGGEQAMSQPVGIGTGRVYLPGRPDLMTADPDTLAAATFPCRLVGSYPVHIGGAAPQPMTSVVRQNRYSAPHGN